MSAPEVRPGADGPSVHVHTQATGDGQTNILGQGVQNVFTFGERPARAAVVVEQVVAEQAAARSLFVGRRAQVDLLLGLLDPSGSGPGTGVVSAIGGMGGVGKTALARHVAQIAVGRGWFPGGAVWVDLRGYAADPADRVGPGQAFGPLLRGLGVPAEQIPPWPAEQAAAYHHHLRVLAEADRAVLVVLDNVSGVDQVAGLVPRHSVHRVVVTSRHTLGELGGARIVDLDVLDPAESVDLVDQSLGQRDPADRRAAADPAGVAALVEVCGRLPLAVRIAAALLADDPGLAVSDLVGELADAAGRVDALAYGSTGVAAAFDLSWHHLTERDPAAARLFRLLPVNPGPDLATETAAALADLPVGRVRWLLRALRRAHLLQPDTRPDRWVMHDLVRAYATGLPEDHPGDRAAATARLLDHYTHTADAADTHLRALPGEGVSDRFAAREQALDWLDAERTNLTAAVTLAAATGHHSRAFALAIALAEYLSWRRYLDEWVATATTARDAARHLDNPASEGEAWTNLGVALREMRRFDQAIAAHTTARDLFAQTGDRHGEAMAWTNLGAALREVRRYEEAIAAHTTARDLFAQTGDRHREGVAWTNLGLALWQVRRFDEAIGAHTTARDLFRQTGDRYREGKAWTNLGLALQKVRRFDEAIAAHQHSLEIHQQTGDRHGEGKAWNNLGLALQKVRRFDEAIDAHHQSLQICQQTGDRHGEGKAWNNLGLALQKVRRFDEAIDACATARDLFQQTGDRHGEGVAWGNLAGALRLVQRFDEAIDAAGQAVAAFTETGAAHRAEEAHRALRDIARAAGRPDGLSEARP